MNIKQARKILGKQASGIPDAVLLKDIETAELLKSLFFDMVVNSYKSLRKTSKPFSNVP